MAILTDLKRHTITLTQPVLELGRMSNAAYHYAPKNPETARMKYHQGEMRPKVLTTKHFITYYLHGRKKMKIGDHFFKIIFKEPGQGCREESFGKAKPRKMARVKVHFKKSSYQGTCQVQYNKIMKVGRYKP